MNQERTEALLRSFMPDLASIEKYAAQRGMGQFILDLVETHATQRALAQRVAYMEQNIERILTILEPQVS